MSNYHSQEQTIYRNLSGKIQMGFYDNGERFPSVKEIADRFHVSYCPAQRALKLLEKDGQIKLYRGSATAVLKKPYENYLESNVFKRRIKSVLDLCHSLELISPAHCTYNIQHFKKASSSLWLKKIAQGQHAGRGLYQQFERSLHLLGNQTVLSLYYDISSFSGSAFLDILYLKYGKEKADSFLQHIASEYADCIRNQHQDTSFVLQEKLEKLCGTFFDAIKDYLRNTECDADSKAQEFFSWEPRKGRTRYCDVVAIDMICRINQDVYPVGTRLPNSHTLADIYHISGITVRRTIALLNKLGVTETVNGVGTFVISRGGPDIPYKLKDLTLDDNMRDFLEALQILAIISAPVMLVSLPHVPRKMLKELFAAASIPDEKKSLVHAVSIGLQSVIRYCPFAAMQEIYKKLTLLLLKGSILRLEETGAEPVTGWTKISASIRKSCAHSDYEQLARAFQSLFQNNFASSKQLLLEIGVEGVEKITGF